MNKFPRLFLVLMLIVYSIALYLVILVSQHTPRTVRVDCSIAEISPDYPIEIKQKCRELHTRKL